MAGIDSLVNSRADMFAANPQGLQQRYAMGQDLLDLLALQKLKKDKEAAQRSLQMQMQPESGTVKDQLEDELMQATKQEIASSLAPGLQQQGQMMQAQQMQQAMAGGLPTQPAPNMANMARGGIVGYKEGDLVGGVPYSREALRAFDERRQLERELRAAGVAEAEAKAIAQDPVSAQNVLSSAQNVRNMPSPAREGVASVLSEGTPERGIPVSMDALRRFDERRATRTMPEPTEGEPTTPYERALERSIESYERAREQSIERARRKEDEIAAATQLVKRYQVAADPVFGFFKPQTDEEQAFAQQVIKTLPDISYADKLALLATGEIPTEGAAPRYQGTDEDVASMLGEGIARTPPRATEASTPAPAPEAGIPSLVPPPAVAPSQTTGGLSAKAAAMQAIGDRAQQYQATEEDIASALGEDVAPMQRAAPTAPTDSRMSRYEDQLARLEAEEKDKLGALIDFLLAAGASGGTNLGATLMGGGSGLQAREQRIQDEMAQTIQNIETLQLEREKMTSEDERAKLSRENQLAVARVQSQNQQRPTDTAQMIDDYTAYFMAQNPGMSELDARFKARQQVQSDDIARATAASGLQQPNREAQTLLDLEGLVTKNVEAAIEAMPLDKKFTLSPEARAAMETAERNRLMQAIYPEQGQSTVPQGQRPPLESMFNQ